MDRLDGAQGAGAGFAEPEVRERPPAALPAVLTCPGYGNEPRWRRGERLEGLFEDRCDELRASGRGDHLAVDAGDLALTYDQLDARANRLARHLLARGTRPGDRVALLLDQAVHTYVAMLAVLKAGAAYVPLDAGFPPDRLAYIVGDAGASTVLTLSHLQDRLPGDLPGAVLCLDEAAADVAAEDGGRLADVAGGGDALCYIIYTSGSTGRPKGVAVRHSSICNFVRVAAEVYGYEAAHRVYQGLTIAFDFSVEEIWVPWMVGATLVPKPGGTSLLGEELGAFLRERRVTAMCCVPTLLATLEEPLPELTFLLVSGEACPKELIARWSAPGRRFLNVYGPTEATVTATWAVARPDKPVTIGVPLPTYSVVILDPDRERALPRGEAGEVGIAGLGLAVGYVNRPDLTGRAFVRDFVGIADNPSGRIYRTGDLGRVNGDGEIEYLGRIDTQVKIRGYRVELTEIESVLLRVPGIAQAVVNTWEPEPGRVELVAYYSLRPGHAGGAGQELIQEELRGQLPAYMVPAYFEELAAIPMLPSDKADRKSLPPPKGPRSLAAQQGHVEPATDAERVLAEALAQTLRLDRVSVDSHFFDDLGANSLLMAQFCAKLRRRGDLSPVSMRDVYVQPTVRSLAAVLAGGASPEPVEEAREEVPDATVTPASTASYVLCGALQVLAFLASSYVGAIVLVTGLEWVMADSGFADVYLRSVLFGAGSLALWCAAPIFAKWLLVGRWKREEFPIWSLAYVRFWFVKTMIRSSPMLVFRGSPLYNFYLRALGARIGRGVVILSEHVPVCTDLLAIGDGTVIRKGSFFNCYRAHAGRIQTGSVSIGKDALVCEATVLDIDTAMGDRAQLGRSSSLHPSQAVPDGERWHGSPAVPTETDYRGVEPARCSVFRRVTYSALQVLALLLLGPLGFGVAVLLLAEIPLLAGLFGPGHDALSTWTFYRDAVLVSFALFFGGIIIGLAFVFTVPRAMNLVITPGKIYPLYGFHYAVQQAITRMTNVSFFTDLFGDSSYIVHYLRALGYDLGKVEQTGSNFGTEVKHDSPYLTRVGTGTMISDALTIINADFSSTSFRVSPTSLGSRCFYGNSVAFPSNARTGDNCLFATMAMVPIDGKVRENVGLLGSPCFEIPRSVQRDGAFDHLRTGEDFHRRLAAKNRYNLAVIGEFLLVRWVHSLGLTVLALAALDLYHLLGASALVAFGAISLIFSLAYFVVVERASAGFRPLSPQYCSIYDPYFWWHERVWKFLVPKALGAFNGTPFKGPIWRLLGVRIGRRVYDDGCDIAERTLATVGDDCTLNAGTAIQCHSLEDGAFKSDRIVLGAGCTLGINAFVHYGATLGDGAVLEADSFLMKGEEVAPRARWRGNPAREMRGRPTAVAAATIKQLPPPALLPFPAFDRGRDAHVEAAE